MSISLEAKGICKSFGSRTVVNKVSFSINSGEIVGLLGPNGAGKTTSFYMMVGLVLPEHGKVSLAGEEITSKPMHLRAQMGISYLPQSTSIFRRMTVADNLSAVMQIARVPHHKRVAMLDSLLDRFQVGHVRDSLGSALSGGERRRVEIARSLIIQPKFLLLDEPFAGVDPVTVQEVQSLISQLREDGLGVLITDHNVRETLGICDRAYVLSRGEIIADGTPRAVAADAKVRKSYLGEGFEF